MHRKPDLFMVAKERRSQGRSYSEIHRELGIARSTLSLWFSKQKWSAHVKEQLNDTYKKINATRLIQMNRAKRLKKIERHERYRVEARLDYTRLKSNLLFIAGISIYWGEGEKSDNGRVSVINTDPEMIQVMAAFYRKILHISDVRLRGALFIYKDIDVNASLDYWSNTTKIPITQFIKTQVIPSRSHHTKRKTLYGICNIYFSSTEINIKMREWIKLVSSQTRV